MTVLYEDRSVLAIDKPAGWMLAPESWQHTSRNLQAVLVAGVRSGEFWARARGLKFLRFVHRLDADTSGVLLLARSPGTLRALSELFETRRVEKVYLAVVRGVPRQQEWTCRLKIGPDPRQPGRMRVDPRQGKAAETHFRVLASNGTGTLVEARPKTGRTHQIRVHLAAADFPVLGDSIYSHSTGAEPRATRHQPVDRSLALRAVGLAYIDPFTHRQVRIRAPSEDFLQEYGFADHRLETTGFEDTKTS